MKGHTAFEFNPQMPAASQKVFDLFRLVSIGALLLAVAIASLIAT